MATLPFAEMWGLILRHHLHSVTAVSPELLIAIFWHESLFENIPQRHGRGNAVGFGQVESAYISALSAGAYVASRLSDGESVEVASLALRGYLHQRRWEAA